MPTQTKLTLGVINLEETDNAITAEQAKELIPMFYVLQDLNESDTAAQEEIDGLVAQIQETLTDAQVQSIDNMGHSMRDMFAITQGGSGKSSASNTSSTSSTNGRDMGGPPDMDGGGMRDGGMPGGSTTSTGSETNAMPAMNTSTPTALFEAVIKFLEKKIQ